MTINDAERPAQPSTHPCQVAGDDRHCSLSSARVLEFARELGRLVGKHLAESESKPLSETASGNTTVSPGKSLRKSSRPRTEQPAGPASVDPSSGALS